MTAQAPASSAIFACSGVTTSMMTPPLSICASPFLTAQVPVVRRARRSKTRSPAGDVHSWQPCAYPPLCAWNGLSVADGLMRRRGPIGAGVRHHCLRLALAVCGRTCVLSSSLRHAGGAALSSPDARTGAPSTDPGPRGAPARRGARRSTAVAFYLVPAAAAQRLVDPTGLRVATVLPGRTLCTIGSVDYRDNDLGTVPRDRDHVLRARARRAGAAVRRHDCSASCAAAWRRTSTICPSMARSRARPARPSGASRSS